MIDKYCTKQMMRAALPLHDCYQLVRWNISGEDPMQFYLRLVSFGNSHIFDSIKSFYPTGRLSSSVVGVDIFGSIESFYPSGWLAGAQPTPLG